ncbi:unnamed protein product, partial [Ectocarpus sp. 6 AP-2014]
MKKRAIHTAASYDEFRHMVSCAQLNPVTWKCSQSPKGVGKDELVVSPPPRRFQGALADRKRPEEHNVLSTLPSAGPLRAPKDHAQFQRDWRRRCRTNGERRDYLRLIGPKNVSALFRVEMEPDVLGQVLSVVCEEGDAGGSAAETANGSASADKAGARVCVEWLWALSRTGRFAVNILFLADNEKQDLARAFDLISAVLGDE